MPERPPYLSWSQLDTFASCGEKYRLSYIEQVPRAPKGYFIGGHAIHATIEESEASGWWGEVEAFRSGGEGTVYFHDLLDAEYAKESEPVTWGGRKSREFPEGENLDWWHGRGPMMLRRYASLRRQDEAAGMGRPQTEVRVSMEGPEGRTVLGYIDQFFRWTGFGGEAEGLVRDYKTGSKFTPDHPLQLVLYGRAMGKTDITVARGQFIYLRAADGRLVYEVDLSPWYDILDALMDEWAQAMSTGQFIHRPSWQCKTCDVAAFCSVGSRLGGDG